MDWIPCVEKMPEMEVQIIATNANYTDLVRRRFGYWMSSNCTYSDGTFTHWMPIPKRPESIKKMTIEEMRDAMFVRIYDNRATKESIRLAVEEFEVFVRGEINGS